MSIEPGQRLLHYEIVDKLGEGGMGVVWRARDTKLERQVAIKVLPEALSAEPERLARFEREARLLASLNHPNIATVHGLHEAAGIRFLAMELVEGEDLATRLGRGPVPLDEALEIARRIARGVGAAHAKGVIHRDLKPANVRIACDGQVKVLDFGLAKAFDADAASGDPSLSPTLTSAGTVAGAILGTAAYMAPEQARGREVDKRADVWAFGCMLCEMLSGRPTFAGETISDTLASVLKDRPDMNALPGDTPPAVRRVLARCLTKDPDNRIHDIADARLDLEASAEEPQAVAVAAGAPRSNRWMPALLGIVALAAIAAAVGLWIARPDPPARRVQRFALALEEPASFMQRLALSPDETQLVYLGGDPPTLRRRALDRLESTAIQGLENARNPFFSPDGAWLGFYSEDKLRKMPVSGGPTVALCDLDRLLFGAAWSTDGTIYFSTLSQSRNRATLYRVADSGGTPELLFELSDAERDIDFLWPTLLPGERSLLYSRASLNRGLDPSLTQVKLLDLDTLERSLVLEEATFGRYVASGHVVGIAEGGDLVTVPFDPGRGVATGGVVTLEAKVHLQGGWWPTMTLSENGTLIYFEGEDRRGSLLSWLEPSGERRSIVDQPRQYAGPRISPDGRHIALGVKTGTRGAIHVLDTERGSDVPISPRDANCGSPIWTPDNAHVIYSESLSGEDTRGRIVMRRADGGSEPVTILNTPDVASPSSVSPDGKTLLFSQRAVDTDGRDIWMVPIDGGAPEKFIATEHDETRAAFSPDDRWVAYESSKSGQVEIYLRPRSGGGGDAPVSIDDNVGRDPRWSDDGTVLFYRSDDPDRVMRVAISPGGRIGTPELVMELNPRDDQPVRFHDILPDGTILVTARPGEDGEGDSRAVVVLNWLDELERLAPNR